MTRSAVENAASIAGMILTTEALITDIPEKEPAMPAVPAAWAAWAAWTTRLRPGTSPNEGEVCNRHASPFVLARLHHEGHEGHEERSPFVSFVSFVV